MPLRRLPHGTSLVELLLVLALIGILAALAVPSLSGHLHSHRVRATLDRLSGDIFFARMHAARTARRVEIRFEPEPAGPCVPRYHVVDLGPPPTTLRTVEVTELLPRGCLRDNNKQPLRFNSRGLPAQVVARTLTARSGATEGHLIMSQLGRVRRAE